MTLQTASNKNRAYYMPADDYTILCWHSTILCIQKNYVACFTEWYLNNNQTAFKYVFLYILVWHFSQVEIQTTYIRIQKRKFSHFKHIFYVYHYCSIVTLRTSINRKNIRVFHNSSSEKNNWRMFKSWKG